MLEKIQGKRTYIVAFGVVVAAAVGFLTGDANLQQTLLQILEGLGLATLRAGVAK